MWNELLANIRESKAFVLLCIVLIVFGVYWYKKPPEKPIQPQSRSSVSGPSPLVMGPDLAKTDVAEENPLYPATSFIENSAGSNRLERNCKSLNYPDMAMTGLKKLLGSNEKLDLIYDESLHDLKIPAIELGNTSLGNIIVGLLSPHDLAVYRQDTNIYVIPATYNMTEVRDLKEPAISQICSMSTSFTLAWRKAANLWIDTSAEATHLRIGIQPFTEKKEDQFFVIQVEARRNNHTIFQSNVETTLHKPALFESSGRQKIRLSIEPIDLTGLNAILKLDFESEILELP